MVIKKLVDYEDAVRWMRKQPELAETVNFCYLDEDNLAAAKRFSSSEEFAEIIKILHLDSTDQRLKILDVGCGNGISSYAFASRGHEVYAVDPDPSEDVGLLATQRLAAEVSNGSISTTQAVAESLPFSDATFDIIYARQALHHFTDLDKGLAECSRVLKPKGILLGTREHVVNDEQQLKLFLESHLLHKMHGGENAFPLSIYEAAIERSGLRILKIMAPFDTVINHFPLSNIEIINWLFNGLERKLGKVGASLLINISTLQSFYRYRLSSSCNNPGRLYSFLCIK